MKKIFAASRETYQRVENSLGDGDVLAVSTVKIFDDNKENALNEYLKLWNKGVILVSVQEPNLSTGNVLKELGLL